MSSIATESPQIEIPNNEPIIPSMAPKNTSTRMESVNDNQYSNIFEPVINGPSGSAPQTPAASPIASAIEQNGSMSSQMNVMSSFGSNGTSFVNTTVSTDMFNVSMNQMVPVLNNNDNNTNNNSVSR